MTYKEKVLKICPGSRCIQTILPDEIHYKFTCVTPYEFNGANLRTRFSSSGSSEMIAWKRLYGILIAEMERKLEL